MPLESLEDDHIHVKLKAATRGGGWAAGFAAAVSRCGL